MRAKEKILWVIGERNNTKKEQVRNEKVISSEKTKDRKTMSVRALGSILERALPIGGGGEGRQELNSTMQCGSDHEGKGLGLYSQDKEKSCRFAPKWRAWKKEEGKKLRYREGQKRNPVSDTTR